MGYRVKQHAPKPKLQRTVADLATPSGVFVNQGVLAHFAIPCWYQEVHRPIPVHPHDRHWHDHVGWPSPMHPGHSCQLWTIDGMRPYIGIDPRHIRPRKFVDLDNLFPIHLTAEGYTGVDLYIDGELQEDSAENCAWIDEDDDWVVRVNLLFGQCESNKPEQHDIAVFANAESENPLDARRDLVAHSRVTVMPTLALPEPEI